MNKLYKKLSTVLEQSYSLTDQDPAFNRWFKGGLASLVRIVNDKEYGQTKKNGPRAKTFSKSKGIPIGVFYYKLYKINKDKCKFYKTQNDKQKCYSNIVNIILKRIRMDLKAANLIRDQEIKNRIINKLNNQYTYYSSKHSS